MNQFKQPSLERRRLFPDGLRTYVCGWIRMMCLLSNAKTNGTVTQPQSSILDIVQNDATLDKKGQKNRNLFHMIVSPVYPMRLKFIIAASSGQDEVTITKGKAWPIFPSQSRKAVLPSKSPMLTVESLEHQKSP